MLGRLRCVFIILCTLTLAKSLGEKRGGGVRRCKSNLAEVQACGVRNLQPLPTRAQVPAYSPDSPWTKAITTTQLELFAAHTDGRQGPRLQRKLSACNDSNNVLWRVRCQSAADLS